MASLLSFALLLCQVKTFSKRHEIFKGELASYFHAHLVGLSVFSINFCTSFQWQ